MPVSLQPPQPILPARPGTGPHAGLAQLKAQAGGMPQPIRPGRPGGRSEVGQAQAMPKPILPARATAGGGGRGGVIQGSFAGGRPRVPVRAPRPGQKATFQLKPAATLASGNATPLPDDFAGVRSFSPGRRMPSTIQARMESVFGTSFADVRIHEGPEASSIGALAFTQGSSIFFAPGQYNPNTSQGQRLLGQQLAHVVQQRSGRVRNPFGSGTAVVQDPLLKAEAEMMGSRAAMAQSQAVQAKSLNSLQLRPGFQRQAPVAILPRKPATVATASANPSSRSTPATSHAISSLPSKPVQAMLAPAPILPGSTSSTSTHGVPGQAVQPRMALSAVIARGRELFDSVVTHVGRRVLGL